MKAVVAAFNQEKALVGAFSVITNLRMELFGALVAAVLVEDGDGDQTRCRAGQRHSDRGAAASNTTTTAGLVWVGSTASNEHSRSFHNHGDGPYYLELLLVERAY